MGYSKAEIKGNSKFSDATVRVIRSRGAAGEHPRDLAREYLVAPSTIRKLLNGETYTMVAWEGPETSYMPRAKYQPAPGEIEASLARLSAKLAGTPQALPVSTRAAGYGAKPMPTMEESLAAAARESDEIAARVAQDFAGRDAAADAQLAGLLDSNEIPSRIPVDKKEPA